MNLHFVRKITRSQAVLKDGREIPLSRKYYEKMNRAMIQYSKCYVDVACCPWDAKGNYVPANAGMAS